MGAGCALILAVIASLLAGAAPALMISRTAPFEVLHCESRLAGESRGNRRARRTLVGIEVAVSVALVLMTGLLTASLVRLMSVDRGFTTERTITATSSCPANPIKATSAVRPFIKRSSNASIACLAWSMLLLRAACRSKGTTGAIWRVSKGTVVLILSFQLRTSGGSAPIIFRQYIWNFSQGDFLFRTNGVRIWLWCRRKQRKLYGLAKTRLGSNSVGVTQLPRSHSLWYGIVKDARTVSLAKPDPMVIYVPYWYRTEGTAGLMVRTRQEPFDIADAIRKTIWDMDGTVPVPEVRVLARVSAIR